MRKGQVAKAWGSEVFDLRWRSGSMVFGSSELKVSFSSSRSLNPSVTAHVHVRRTEEIRLAPFPFLYGRSLSSGLVE